MFCIPFLCRGMMPKLTVPATSSTMAAVPAMFTIRKLFLTMSCINHIPSKTPAFRRQALMVWLTVLSLGFFAKNLKPHHLAIQALFAFQRFGRDHDRRVRLGTDFRQPVQQVGVAAVISCHTIDANGIFLL